MSPTPANLTPEERGRAVRSVGCLLILIGLLAPGILLVVLYAAFLITGGA